MDAKTAGGAKRPPLLLTRLRSYGVRGTIDEYCAQLEDRVFDLKNRTNTTVTMELEDLSIPSPSKRLGHRYAPTPARALRHFLGACEFPPDSVFVDLGCGKGRALLVASRFAFKRVVGVEFSRELCGIAASNVQAYRKRCRDAAPIDVIEADAAEYEVKPDENVFYMFNPFEPDVVGRLVQNISSSVIRHGRPVWIVYNEPSYGLFVESSGTFVLSRTFRYGASKFAVYASRRAPVWPMPAGHLAACQLGRG